MPETALAPSPNEAVVSARQRRTDSVQAENVRIEWFVDQVANKVAMSMRQRVALVTQMLKDRVVRNISTPVIKGTGPRGGRVVTGRSSPGEFPHAETTQLLKTIFQDVRETRPGVIDGYVGTPLDYGLILETKMDRSFLVRTLNEMKPTIQRILTGPIA
jgi:hypothetical protein